MVSLRTLAPTLLPSLAPCSAPALLLSPAPLLGAGQAAVVNADGTCTTNGWQVTCTFSSTGAEQT